MIQIFQKTVRDPIFKRLKEARRGSWVLVIDPDEQEREFLVKNFGLDAETVRDALDPYEIPRLESDEEAIYILLRVPFEENQRILTSPFTFVLTNEYFITITKHHFKIFDYFLKNRTNFATTQASKLLFQFFLLITKEYENYLYQISRNIKAKKFNLQSLTNEDILSLVENEDVLNDFISSLVPIVNIFERLASGKYIFLYEEDKDLIEDLLISSKQTLDLCVANVKTIKNIREAYSTLVSNKLNQIMKFLTAVTILIDIPVAIFSFYGMNIRLPLAENYLAFLYLLCLTSIISLFLAIIFFRRKWL